ncbi:MAG TPA: hypothetical protein VHM20_03210, partial [Gammaproteobacteria bacterium]|nr:hypothetical protein [Gammaproteobacteria bacterium]
MPHLLSKIFIFFIVCWVSAVSADPGEIGNDFYLDKTKVVEQQIELLKNRLNRANDEFSNLQNQQSKQMASLSLDRVNKDWLNWTKLDIDSAKSNLDSISIEISESQQTISFLEKDTQEVENQLNVYDVFGMNVARGGVPNLKNMRSQLTYQKDLLVREKNRLDYLQKLQKVSEKILQIHTVRFQRIENLLKSQTMMQLKEQQAKSEIDYQEQQNIWLHRLNLLNAQAKKLEHAPHKDKAAYMKLSNEIFYANENVNFMYLQMLIARYQDQIAQLKLAISRSTSITLLNKVSEQTQSLFKQFARINSLLSARLNILENRKLFLTQQKISTLNVDKELDGLSHQYHKTTETVNQLSDDLSQLRKTLEQSLQQELSARQGLVGFGLKAWLDLGSEIILLPTLTFQMMKSLSQSVMKILTQGSFMWWLFLIMCETLWAGLIYSFYRLCLKVTSKMTHPSNKVNLKWFF